MRFISLLMISVFANIAFAGEKPLAVVVPPQIGGVVLKADELKQALIAHLAERLRSRGYEVLTSETLTATDADCHERACLEGIPARYNVDLVVAPRLENDDKAHNYRVGVRLFGGNGVGWKSRDRLCMGCADFAARDLLGDTVVEMLGGTIAVSAPPPSPAPVVAAKSDRGGRWVYRGLAIGFGVVGVLSMAQGFAEVAHNGDRGCDSRCYHLDTTKGQATFLTLGLATLVTAGVLAYFGWRHEPKKSAQASRASFGATGIQF